MMPANGDETAKTRWRVVPFTSGPGLDIGCGKAKVFESDHCIGIDSGLWAERGDGPCVANMRIDCTSDLPFTAGTWHYVYSSFLLEFVPYANVPKVLREWMRVIKVGGNLVLYLPDAVQYPKCAEDGMPAEAGAPADQLWNVTYAKVVEAMEKTGFNWDLIHFECCDQTNEYALLFVFKRLK